MSVKLFISFVYKCEREIDRMKIKVREFIEVIRHCKHEDRVGSAVNWLESTKQVKLSEKDEVVIGQQLQRLNNKFKGFMKNNHYLWAVVKVKHQQWLDSDFAFEFKEREAANGEYK